MKKLTIEDFAYLEVGDSILMFNDLGGYKYINFIGVNPFSSEDRPLYIFVYGSDFYQIYEGWEHIPTQNESGIKGILTTHNGSAVYGFEYYIVNNHNIDIPTIELEHYTKKLKYCQDKIDSLKKEIDEEIDKFNIN